MTDIAAYLENAGISDIYIGFEPPEPDSCVVLYEYAGKVLDYIYKPNIEMLSLQVLVRDIDYVNGYERIIRIRDLLYGLRVIVNGTWYFLYPNQTPEFLGRDDNRRISWVLNFTVARERR